MLGFSSFSELPFSTLPDVSSGVAYSLTCNNGSYSVTGQAATLTYVAGAHAYSLTCANGSYTVTGQNATLTYVGAPQNYTLTCANGSYAVTGQSATLTYSAGHTNYTLSCANGTYSVTGQSAILSVAKKLIANNGSYAVTGQAATLTYTPGSASHAYSLSCANGAYFVNGQSAILSYSGTTDIWGSRGGIGHKPEKVKQSKRAEIQEHIQTIFAEPVVEEEILEALQPYVAEEVTPSAIDYKLLLKDISTVQNIIARAQAIQQEHEDEEALLMLI